MKDGLIIDCFAGGGGASCGIEMALGRKVDIAVNHDEKAIRMHKANHPDTLHLTEDIFEVDLQKYVAGRHVALLWASPDCFPAGTLVLTSEGGRPIEEVKVGDMVLTHEKRFRKVTGTVAKKADRLTEVVCGSDFSAFQFSAVSTPNHPFYAKLDGSGEPGWVRAEDLTSGHCVGMMGKCKGAWAIAWMRVKRADTHDTESLDVYCLTVDEDESFVAGDFVVHNCTQFSKAKGGQPRVSGIRMLPWAVHKHVRAVRPDVVLMENVEEIQQWGPLDEDGRQIRSLRGVEFDRFITAMRGLGYSYEGRELVAADYGAPTTRKRWYGVFRCDGEPIAWPEPTNFPDRPPLWEPCGKHVDWADLGTSIFDRKRPLSDKTQGRIANGIRKFILEDPDPYFVDGKDAAAFLIQYHSETKAGDARGQVLGKPVKTLDTSNRYGLVTAFLTKYLPGVTAGTEGHIGEVSAFLIKYYGTGGGQAVTAPLSTIVTKDRFGLVNVVLARNGSQYAISDIFMRMLKPSELKAMQGFPDSYIIDRAADGTPIPRTEQVAKIGNSVSPPVAAALVAANCAAIRRIA